MTKCGGERTGKKDAETFRPPIFPNPKINSTDDSFFGRSEKKKSRAKIFQRVRIQDNNNFVYQKFWPGQNHIFTRDDCLDRADDADGHVSWTLPDLLLIGRERHEKRQTRCLCICDDGREQSPFPLTIWLFPPHTTRFLAIGPKT